jgi:peptide/nickel transport system substrate-binding protein
MSSVEFNRLQGSVLQENFAAVGVALDVRTYEFATLYADVLKGNFQLFTLQWVGVSDPDMLRRVFHSRQMPPTGFNRGFFSHPGVDSLIDRATVLTDDGERRALFAEAQRLISQEVPYISLWYKRNVAVARHDLRGIRLSPSADFLFLRGVTREPLRTTAG